MTKSQIRKAARRCARDLRHAADSLPAGPEQKELYERVDMWYQKLRQKMKERGIEELPF